MWDDKRGIQFVRPFIEEIPEVSSENKIFTFLTFIHVTLKSIQGS